MSAQPLRSSGLLGLCKLKSPKATRLSLKHMNDLSPLKKKFLSVKSFDELALLLDLKPAGLRHFCHSQPYKNFIIAKKGGGYRAISSPTRTLEKVRSAQASSYLVGGIWW